jgi:hypothetical protein
MASFITAGNATNGLQVSSDNTGILELRTGTGSGTTAVTFSTGQRATFPSTISVGNTTPATTGAGITFPAAQSASSDANTLDDYEEGTFTPTFTSGFSVAPTSYTNQLGRYTKIGRFVYFQIDLDANGATANATQIRFGSLPFTAAAAPYGGAFVVYNSSFNTNTGDVYIVSDNTTEIHVNTNTGAARDGNSAGVNINNRIILTGCYQV